MPEQVGSLSWADTPDNKTNWADPIDVEEDFEAEIPKPIVSIDGDIKTVIEYGINKKGQQIKTTRKYKIETRRFAATAARRKKLKKFGLSANDPPGPNRGTTFVSEDVYMQFLNLSHDDGIQEPEDPTLAKLRHQLQYVNFFKTLNSPAVPKGDTEPRPEASTDLGSSDRYVPPNRRAGVNLAGSTMASRNPRDNEQSTIRVTNLSEETKESDLQDLFKPFGPVQRIFLAKDKHTQHSKGFAFITYYHKDDAAKAIEQLCGWGYDHLILNVEWAKPSTNNK